MLLPLCVEECVVVEECAEGEAGRGVRVSGGKGEVAAEQAHAW